MLAGPAGAASAHPLGNFTINHYAHVRIEPERILLDVVIDEAEIPAFQSRQAVDIDEDAELSERELRDGGRLRCLELVEALVVSVGDGAALALRLDEAGLSFPLGVSGLATLRLVCVFSAPLPAAIGEDGATRIAFADTSRQDRLGWREVVVTGDSVAITAVEGEVRSTSPSARLTAYPADLVARPLADGRVVVDAVADASVSAPAFEVPDAEPVQVGVATPGPEPSPEASPSPSALPGHSPAPEPSMSASVMSAFASRSLSILIVYRTFGSNCQKFGPPAGSCIGLTLTTRFTLDGLVPSTHANTSVWSAAASAAMSGASRCEAARTGATVPAAMSSAPTMPAALLDVPTNWTSSLDHGGSA